MSEQLRIPFPMWRVQYQLLGGHRKVWLVTVVYAMVVVFGALVVRRIVRDEPLPTICSFIINGLAAIQCAMLVFSGATSIHRAMLRDYETKMIESHRLTPMSNYAVALGYLIGPNLQTLILFTVNLVIGAVVTAIGGFPVGAWCIANGVFLLASITAWSAVVFSGMRPAKPIPPSWVLGGIAGLTMPIAVVPGLGLMLCVYPFFLGIWIMTGRLPANQSAPVLVGGVNLVFALFWLHCAAVKYRRPDLPALSAVRGLVLLSLWLIVAAVGLVAYDRAAGTSMSFLLEPDIQAPQWLATLLLCIPLAVIVTLGSAECRLVVSQGRAPRNWSDRVPDILIAILAAVLSCLVLCVVAASVWTHMVPIEPESTPTWGTYYAPWLHTLMSFLIATLTARSAYLLFSRRFKLKNPLVSTWAVLLILWTAPPLIDSIRAQVVAGPYDKPSYSWLLGCSPGGTIAAVWLSLDANLMVGYAFQLMILLAAHWFAHRGSRSRH